MGRRPTSVRRHDRLKDGDSWVWLLVECSSGRAGVPGRS